MHLGCAKSTQNEQKGLASSTPKNVCLESGSPPVFDSFIPGGETKVLAGSRAHSAVPAPLQNMRGLPQSQPEQAGEEGAQPAVHAALAFLLARPKVGVGAFPMARGTTPGRLFLRMACVAWHPAAARPGQLGGKGLALRDRSVLCCGSRLDLLADLRAPPLPPAITAHSAPQQRGVSL